MMTVVQLVLRLRAICIALQLLLLLLPLPLQLLYASPCPTTVEEFVVTTTSDAEKLSEALLCDGPGSFVVTWHGNVIVSRTLSVSNGGTLSVAGSLDNTDEEDSGAVIFSDGTVLLFEVDLGSTVSLTGLTFSGGNGAVRVNGESFVEVIDCSFMDNNRTSSNFGGAIFVNGSNVVFKGEIVFANNTADYGGAIYLYNQSLLNSYGTASFVSNEAEDGGAIYLEDSSELNVTEGGSVSFFNNHAAVYAGAIRIVRSVFNSYGTTSFASNEAQHGGAILLFEGIFNNYATASFVSNKAESGGGGAIRVYRLSVVSSYGNASFVSNEAVKGGAIFIYDQSILNSYGTASYVSNEADDGGAIYLYDQSILNSYGTASFVSNEAGDGGAIFMEDNCELNAEEGGNVSFLNNHAADYAGAIRVVRSVFNSYGTALFKVNEARIGGTILLYEGTFNNYGTASFESNKAESGGGGAIRVYILSVVNNYGNASFVFNEATEGGAVYIVGDSSVSFGGQTLFANNTAENGGAIYSSGSTVSVDSGTRFMFNVASTGSGGGVYASKSVISLKKAEFTENRGAWGGGVASFSSGSISDEEIDEFGPSIITGCSFDGNKATDGGAIYTAAGYDMVTNSSFTRNFAAVQGGALLHSGVLVALIGCTFESNMAGEDGLAVMSLGMADNISASSFQSNSFFCASGKYGWTEDRDLIEDSDTCRWGVVCSRCTDPRCDVPVGIGVDNITVPACVVVPEGVNTTGNSGMTLETLDVLSGFYRTSNKSKEVLECYREEACIGGSNAGTYCAEGYAGPYCAACGKGYASGFQYSCHSCQGSDKRAAIGGAVAVLVVTIFAVALVVAHLAGVVERPIPDRRKMWKRRALNFRDRLVRATPLTAIKIVLVSWQIITQFSGVVNVQYPPAYGNFLAALSVINLNLGFILALSCVVETNFYARLVLATIAPIVVLGILGITYRVAVMRNGHSIHAMKVVRNKHLSVGLFLLFVVYSSVSHTIFQTFVCDSLDNEVTYLRADYDLVCFTSTHVGYMIYAGVMVLVYPVGIPALYARVLFLNRDDIKSVEETTINNRTRVPPEAEAIKDLWSPYKRSRYYYEVIECGRRIALTGLAVFIYPGSIAQVAIEALLAVVFYSISEILSPFAEPLDAWLYRSGTWVIFLSMYLALLLKVKAADENSHSQDVFAGFLIAAHGGMILVVTANAFLSALKGFRQVRASDIPMIA